MTWGISVATTSHPKEVRDNLGHKQREKEGRLQSRIIRGDGAHAVRPIPLPSSIALGGWEDGPLYLR